MKKVSFETLFEIPLRNGVTKPKKIRGKGYKMVNMGELFSYPIINNISMDRAPLTELEEKNSLLENYDLLFARQSLVRSGAGQCSIFISDDEKVCFESHIIRCRLDKNKANPLFYFYLFRSNIGRNIMDTIIEQGAGASGIRGSDLSKLMIPYIDIKIQNDIAEKLFSLDQKIELNTQTNQTLEQIAQAIFKHWFIDFAPVHAKANALARGETIEQAELAAMACLSGKTVEKITALKTQDPTAYHQLQQTARAFPSEFVESEMGLVPKGWEVENIGNIADVIKGKSYKSNELTNSTTALVTLKSFNRGGGYRIDGLKEYSGKYKPEQEVYAGELIIAYTDVTQAADIIGKPAMVMSNNNYEHLVISLDVAVVRPKNQYLKYFLYCLAMTERFQQHTKSFCSGTTVLHLGKNAVPSFQFAMPNQTLLIDLDKKLRSIFEKINLNIQENESLTKTRDELLPRLLSGEIEL